jgi:hypothetical protein
MRLGLLLCATTVFAGLSGCTSSSSASLTALEAFDAALLTVPGGQLVSIEGLEGRSLDGVLDLPVSVANHIVRATNSTSFKDDGLDDGPLGDGRLSSWVVTLLEDGSLVELRVFADGRRPIESLRGLPEYMLDQRGALFLRDATVDSPEAARAAASMASFAEATVGGAHLYSFSPYVRDLAPRSHYLAQGERALETVGWSSLPGTWTLTRFDPAWVDEAPQPAVVATVDGFEGSLDGVSSYLPVHRDAVFDTDQTFGPTQSSNVLTIEVPAGTRRLTGDFWARVEDKPQGLVAQPRLVLSRPDGSVVYDGPGVHPLETLDLTITPPGTWTLTIGVEPEVPGTVRFHGFLWAAISPVA